jgi:transposase
MAILHSMKRPIFVRPLSDAERESLEAGLRSPDAFTLRRCQILLASIRGKNAYQIAHELGCNPQTARNAIHAFNEKGLEEALKPGSKHPHTVHRAFKPEQAEALRELLHHKPRKFGKDTSLWTLDLAAEVSFEEGLTESRISGETVRATLARLGVRWERAKRWITSPDPEYARKKAARPIDRPGRSSPRVDRRFLGRDLVDSAGATGSQQLERRRRPPTPHRTIGRQRRP